MMNGVGLAEVNGTKLYYEVRGTGATVVLRAKRSPCHCSIGWESIEKVDNLVDRLVTILGDVERKVAAQV